ncbi:hypothetical protein, partial [Massilia timonae]|uniref:hypothetical protein n=1 Tax=Massilia timonae TaxID=47229 RepID=UPI00289B743E
KNGRNYSLSGFMNRRDLTNSILLARSDDKAGLSFDISNRLVQVPGAALERVEYQAADSDRTQCMASAHRSNSAGRCVRTSMLPPM